MVLKVKTIISKINPENMDMEQMKKAGEIIRQGGLVGFPTETVYGLGADGLNDEAAAKIYAAKGRPSDNPLIIHIADRDMLNDLVEGVSEKAEILMKTFWPGPMTLIFDKSKKVPYGTTGGLDTVAIRMPVHPIALELIRQSGVGIAAPSANISGRPSPTEAQHVIDDMDGKIEMIIDGGSVSIGVESTIIDTTCEPPMILRPGYITREMLEEVIGEIEVDKATVEPLSESVRPKAPGMKYRHYAPKADLTMYEGKTELVVKMINSHIMKSLSEGKKVGVIATEETKTRYIGGEVLSIGSRDDEESIARHLYHVLREFDDLKVDVIYSEAFNRHDLGQAIMNRLVKAAGYKIVKCN